MKKDASILSYEGPGDCPRFVPQIFVPVTEDEAQKKIEMLQLYESHVTKRGYFEINAIRGLMI